MDPSLLEADECARSRYTTSTPLPIVLYYIIMKTNMEPFKGAQHLDPTSRQNLKRCTTHAQITLPMNFSWTEVSEVANNRRLEVSTKHRHNFQLNTGRASP